MAVAQGLKAVAGRTVFGAVVEEERRAGVGDRRAPSAGRMARGAVALTFLMMVPSRGNRPLARWGGSWPDRTLPPPPFREGVEGDGAHWASPICFTGTFHRTTVAIRDNRPSINRCARHANCRIGSASRNSLASSSSGCSGSVVQAVVPRCLRQPLRLQRAQPRRTSRSDAAAAPHGTSAATRSPPAEHRPSACRGPGPASTSSTGFGLPISSQVTAAHSPGSRQTPG